MIRTHSTPTLPEGYAKPKTESLRTPIEMEQVYFGGVSGAEEDLYALAKHAGFPKRQLATGVATSKQYFEFRADKDGKILIDMESLGRTDGYAMISKGRRIDLTREFWGEKFDRGENFDSARGLRAVLQVKKGEIVQVGVLHGAGAIRVSAWAK